MQPAKRVKKNKGFTLMELMIAAGILVVSITALLSCFIYGMILNESNANLVLASEDAQSVLEQAKLQAYSNLTNFTNDYDSGSFSNLQNETVDVDFDSSSGEMTVNVSWVHRDRTNYYELSTIFDES